MKKIPVLFFVFVLGILAGTTAFAQNKKNKHLPKTSFVDTINYHHLVFDNIFSYPIAVPDTAIVTLPQVALKYLPDRTVIRMRFYVKDFNEKEIVLFVWGLSYPITEAGFYDVFFNAFKPTKEFLIRWHTMVNGEIVPGWSDCIQLSSQKQ